MVLFLCDLFLIVGSCFSCGFLVALGCVLVLVACCIVGLLITDLTFVFVAYG